MRGTSLGRYRPSQDQRLGRRPVSIVHFINTLPRSRLPLFPSPFPCFNSSVDASQKVLCQKIKLLWATECCANADEAPLSFDSLGPTPSHPYADPNLSLPSFLGMARPCPPPSGEECHHLVTHSSCLSRKDPVGEGTDGSQPAFSYLAPSLSLTRGTRNLLFVSRGVAVNI